MTKRLFYSRLTRKEEQRNLKRAIFFTILTIGFIVALIFFGPSLLVKFSGLLANTQKEDLTLSTSPSFISAPRLNYFPENAKEETLSVSGFARTDSIVEVFINDSSQGTTVATGSGNFAFEKVLLSTGKNEIYVIAKDQSGNKSQPSEKLITNFDNTPPQITIDEPKDELSLTSEKNRKIKISGQTEDEVLLTINNRVIILGRGGRFSVDFTLADGQNPIKIIATDKAGNQTEQTINVNFQP